MKSLRLLEIEAKAGDPFENCKLDRKKYAEILTNIIDNYSDGFVLALNNRWGEGKTTFVRMWRLYLGQSERSFKTLYFNAWEHDFNHDPLSAILSELKTLNIYEKYEFAPLLKKGAKLTKSLIPVVLGAIAEKYIDTKSIKEAFQKLSEEAADIFEEEVNDYANKKKGLEDFKIELEKYVSKIGNKPLVFFIDELDRCNPKYAVELLELIKHFFSVPGIIFVVSIDKDQLSNSIKGYFGSESINSQEYLRRFFDLEFSLPRPNIISVVDWMLDKYNIKQFNKIISYDEFGILRNFSIEYLRDTDLPIRLIEKLFLQIQLSLATIKPKHAVFSEQLFILILVKFFDNQLFSKIKNKSLNIKDFIKSLDKFISVNNTVKTEFNLPFIEVTFVFLYSNNFRDQEYNQDIITQIQNDKYLLTYQPTYDISENYFYTISRINEFKRNYITRYTLDDIIKRIELLDELQS